MTARLLAVSSIAVALAGGLALAQSRPNLDALKRGVERRFDVLPLRDGLALKPRAPSSVRSIELSGEAIAVDGSLVSGAELRDKLGADADMVIQLSYLSDADRRDLFSTPPSADRAPPQSVPDRVRDRLAERLPRIADRAGRRNGDRVRIFGSVTVNAGEVVPGDVVAIWGPVRVDGQVSGDVVGIGRGVSLGPDADVTGDVTSVGGPLSIDPSAHVAGDTTEVAWGPGRVGDFWGQAWRGMVFSATFALFTTAIRIAVLCLLAALVILLGRDYVERIAARAASEPVKAGAIGLLAQVLFVPLMVATVVVLVVTIIGIPLLVLIPFALLGLVLVALVGFTAVALQVGRLLSARVGWSAGVYAMTIVGILALVSPLLLVRFVALIFPLTFGLGIVATVVEYLAWTVGFGAVALTRFSRNSQLATLSPQQG